MLIIGIAGALGSGKMTIAQKLRDHFPENLCTILQLRDYLPHTEQHRLYDENAVELEKLQADLARLSNHASKESIKIVLIVGSLALHAKLLEKADVKIYVEADLDLCLTRRIKKARLDESQSTAAIIAQYEAMKKQYVNTIAPTKEQADIVVSNNRAIGDIDVTEIAELISSKLNAFNSSIQQPRIINPTFNAAQNNRLVQGMLYIISGPSGVGKSTLIKQLLNQEPWIEKLIPYTTRQRRDSEVDGIDYHFKSKEDFQRMIESEPMLEHFIDPFTQQEYGIPAKEVQAKLNQGKTLILDVGPEVLAQVRQKVGNVRAIFICPPAITQLMTRIELRDGAVDNRRYKRTISMLERASYSEFDYLIINDDLEKATAALTAILFEGQLTLKRQLQQNAVLLNRLKLYTTLEKLKSDLPTDLVHLKLDACEIQSLSSLTNSSYKISAAEKTYFLRIPRPDNESYRIETEQEKANLARANELGLYPEVLHYDIETGTYLAPFVEGCNVLSPQAIESAPALFPKVVSALRQLHNAKLLTNDYSYLRAIEHNLLKLKARNARLTKDMDSLAVVCHRLADLLARSQADVSKQVPCHNDINPYNMLYQAADNLLIISDWECAGNNDLFWDLAKLSVEFAMTPEQDEALLVTYFEKKVNNQALSRLRLFKVLVEFQLAIWARWQMEIGNNAAMAQQFEQMFSVRMDNCRKYVNSRQFKEDEAALLATVKLPIELPRVPLQNCLQKSKAVTIRSSTRASLQAHGIFRVPAGVGNSQTTTQRTLVILKPEISHQNRIGAVMQKLEEWQLKVIGLKLRKLSQEEVDKLYAPKLATDQYRYDVLDLMTAGPAVIIALEGTSHLIEALSSKDYKGATDPKAAKPGTLRQLFGTNAKWNAVHCSDNAARAESEIALFFKPDELYTGVASQRAEEVSPSVASTKQI